MKDNKSAKRSAKFVDEVVLMEPMMPEDSQGYLEELAYKLSTESKSLSKSLHPKTSTSVGTLLRSMNCYYSNLIEGHNTHPLDIEKALKEDFSKNEKKETFNLKLKLILKFKN